MKTTEQMTIKGTEISFFIPLKIKHRPGKKTILIPENTEDKEIQETQGDTTLLNLLITAHRWQLQINCGKYRTLKELWKKEKLCPKWGRRIYKMNYLSPPIKRTLIKRKTSRLTSSLPT